MNHIVARAMRLSAFALLLAFGATQAASAQTTSSPDEHANHQHHAGPAGAEDPPTAEVVDGVQVVEVNVSNKGYTPHRIALEAGVPARFVFTRTEQAGCADHVQIPAFGVEKTALPLHEPVTIEFTPTEGGEYAFTCGMKMMKGTLLVKS